MFVGEQKDSRFQPGLHQEKRLASDKHGVSIDTNSKCWTWGEMIGRRASHPIEPTICLNAVSQCLILRQ